MGQYHDGQWDNRTVGHLTMGQWDNGIIDHQCWDNGTWNNAKWDYPCFKSGYALIPTHYQHNNHRRHRQDRHRQHHHRQHSWFVHPRRCPSLFIKQNANANMKTLVSCGVRTHAELPPVDLESTPLTTRAN